MNWLFGDSDDDGGKKNKEKKHATSGLGLGLTRSDGLSPPSDTFSWLYNPYISIPISCAGVLGTMMIYRRYLRRIKTADYITPRTLSRRSNIRGYVTSVGDADNFRMVHTPAPWPFSKLQRIPTDKKVLKDNTIHIRLAGVDAPEVGVYAVI